MPEYKKKKVNRLRSAPRPKRNEPTEQSDIVMSSSDKRDKKKPEKKAEPFSDMRVLRGKKLERRRKLRGLVSLTAAAAVICYILHMILPVGIYENLQNLTALIGNGGYPTELESTDTLNAASRGMYYYVLTDTRLNAYANSGKKIYSYAHGFENPVMKTSKTRAMVFSQGGNEAFIYNLREQKAGLKTESEIITADISDSGVYALALQSDSYASVVSVYGKNNRLIYEWYSSEDTVNNVAVSPNGKKIAVSTFNASSGAYNSKISILSFDSATPEFTEEYSGMPIYAIDNTHSSGFSVITENAVRFIGWSDHEKSEYKNEYTASMFRAGSGGSAAVFNRSSDKTDNRIALFNSKGHLKNEFEFKGIISDIEIHGGHIYCISDTSVFILDADGSVIRKAECGFGAVRLAVLGTNTVAVITDNQIDKIKLEQE